MIIGNKLGKLWETYVFVLLMQRLEEGSKVWPAKMCYSLKSSEQTATWEFLKVTLTDVLKLWRNVSLTYIIIITFISPYIFTIKTRNNTLTLFILSWWRYFSVSPGDCMGSNVIYKVLVINDGYMELYCDGLSYIYLVNKHIYIYVQTVLLNNNKRCSFNPPYIGQYGCFLFYFCSLFNKQWQHL